MNQYSKRRDSLFNQMQNNSITVVFSGKSVMRSEDESYPFCVNRNFYYLTGVDAEEMVLIVSKINGKKHEYLFIPPYDELEARWVGGRMTSQHVTGVSEIEDIEDVGDLDDFFASMFNHFRSLDGLCIYFDMWHYEIDQEETLAIAYCNKLKYKYPTIIFKDLYPMLTAMREVKDEYEIACIRNAIHTTNVGILQMMKTIKPNMNEMVMEGVFDFVLRQSLCKENAFPTIAASGKRATTLHYQDNNQTMLDNELFLCDLGATCNHYCADISRTFPVNGKFSERQKEIYELVLGAQKIVEENAKAGTTLRKLNQLVIDYYKAELPKHNLTKDVSEYYFHSVSHHLGLDTHDVSFGADNELKPGNVITNEPGLYIADEGIGIRIEDDLLIRQDGCEVLSREIMKNIVDIENNMVGQH